MLYDEFRNDRHAKRVSAFEEKWSWRMALLVGAVGLISFVGLLVDGFRSQSQERASGPLVPCRTLVDRSLRALMLGAHTPPAVNPWQVSEGQRKQWLKEFERGPLYARISRDVLRWLEEARHLEFVIDDSDERKEVVGFLSSRFLEINDPKFIANLEKTPSGLFLLDRCGGDKLSKDRTKLILTYGNIVTHYTALLGLDMSHVRQVHRETESVLQRMPLGLELPETPLKGDPQQTTPEL